MYLLLFGVELGLVEDAQFLEVLLHIINPLDENFPFRYQLLDFDPPLVFNCDNIYDWFWWERHSLHE